MSLGSAGSNNKRFCVSDASNKYKFVAGNNDISFNSTMNLLWQHVAVAYEMNSLKLYIDGIFAEQDTILGIDTSAEAHGMIGRCSRPADIEYYNGLIDDVRIYDRALSSAEVQAIYNLGQ